MRTLTNNANDYSSKTNLNGGRLRVGANGALGASTVVFNGGTISSDGSTARTIANALSITGAIVIGNSTDNGKLTFTNASTLTTGARTWTVNSDAEFQMNLDHSTGTMTKEGAGNLFLSGGGSLARLDINNGTMTVSTGTYNSNNFFTVNTTATNPGNYVQTGGTFNLTSATNGAYIGNAASSTSTFTVSGGAFNVNNSEGLIMRNNGTATMTVSGAGQLSSTGTGGLSYQKSGSTGTFNLGDGTTFSGGTSINDGGTSGVFTASKVVRTVGTSANNIFNFNGGTLKASAATFTFADNTNIAANVMAGGGVIDNNTFDITIGQNLLNGGGTDGGMVFKGTGTTTLTGTNSYTGNTTVTGGTLKLGNGAANTSLADASTVTIAAGAVLNLNFPTGPATSDTVKKLYLGTPAVQVPAGVYDSSTPTYGSYFASTGSLTVTDGPPASGYASWALSKPGFIDTAVGSDPDNDGIKNLLEYVLNGNPMASDMAILPTLNIVGPNFIFAFTRRLDSASDTIQKFDSSTDLNDWTTRPPLTIPAAAGTYGEVVVGPATGTAPNEVQAITITIPKGAATKLFGRLNVSQ